MKRRNTMDNEGSHLPAKKTISYPRFAAFYTWLTERPAVQRWEDPLRREIVGQEQGLVLEVVAGGGQNFPFYNADRVVRVEATEPDEAMLEVARRRLARAPVPITLTDAPVEALPFPDAHFDCAVATAVFCSVDEPMLGLREIRLVLKPGGMFFLLEHVRAQGKGASWIHAALVPVTRRLTGNCHWNRDTRQAVLSAGFLITQERKARGGLQPVLILRAIRLEPEKGRRCDKTGTETMLCYARSFFSTLLSSTALVATMIELALMASAPTSGASRMPKG